MYDGDRKICSQEEYTRRVCLINFSTTWLVRGLADEPGIEELIFTNKKSRVDSGPFIAEGRGHDPHPSVEGPLGYQSKVAPGDFTLHATPLMRKYIIPDIRKQSPCGRLIPGSSLRNRVLD